MFIYSGKRKFSRAISQDRMLFVTDLYKSANQRNGIFRISAGADQSPSARSTSYRRTRPQGALHTASGSKASTLSPQIVRKNSASSQGLERHLPFSHNTNPRKTNNNNITQVICYVIFWII